MTIVNESVRLFFAIFALILVGMLSSPVGGDLSKPSRALERTVASINSTGLATHGIEHKSSATKASAKKLAKIAKSSRKIARRG